MANKIQPTEQAGACSELLKAIGLIGLSDKIGAPGEYTCLPVSHDDEITLYVLPGSFTESQAKEIFKAAA